MMGKSVKPGVGTVYVSDADGNRHTFTAGQDVPEWAELLMVDVTVDADVADDGADPAQSAASDAGTQDGPPPKHGKGSGLHAWLDYAEQAGVDVPDGASRDDVIAAVEAAD